MTRDAAKAAGYQSITVGYKPGEEWMMENVINDMRNADIVRVPVMLEGSHANEIWRRPNGAGRKD